MKSMSIIATLILIAAAWPAKATQVRCVDTSSELDAAVRLATDEDVVIHLVRGTYDVHGTILENFGYQEPEPDDDLTIVGGYAPGCATRLLDPFATVLTSTGDPIYISGGDNSGDLRIESLTLRDVPLQYVPGSFSSRGYRLTSSRVAVTGDAYISTTATYVDLFQVIAERTTQDCAVGIGGDSLDELNVYQSVFTSNVGKGLCVRSTFDDGAEHIAIYNSIFWNNGASDVYVRRVESDSTDITMVRNIVQTTSIVPAPLDPPSGSLNQNPLFENPQADDFHLQVASPAINSGSTAALGITQDTDGGPRQIGSAPDRGAYESNVDDTQIITVTNTSDQLSPLVVGSLRWAITQANADPGLNYIRFNISGSCPRIINLNAPLPLITDRVIIEGYTQPGSDPNSSSFGFNATICIGIRGDLSDNYGFRIPSSIGASHYLQLSGVAIGGFDVAAIDLAGGAGSWIHGVQFGGQLGATSIGNSAVNVRVSGATYYNLIGGDDVGDRNVIPFAYTAGVQLLASNDDGHENTVSNNLIGTSATGTASAPNQIGIYVSNRNNKIRDNVISGNTTYGIELTGIAAHDNFIASNRIGLKAAASVICFPPPCDPNEDLGNGSTGIVVLGDASDNSINANRIAYNGGSGIRLTSGQHNSMLSNITYANGGMGIDLGSSGPEPVDNDADPGAATQPNRGINAPAFTLAEGGVHSGRVRSALISTNGNYLVQLFSDATCDPLGHGEGRTYYTTIGATIANASSGHNGTVIFDMPVKSTGTLAGRVFSLTAFDAQGNTSEYSQCAEYVCDEIFGHSFDNTVGDKCPAP